MSSFIQQIKAQTEILFLNINIKYDIFEEPSQDKDFSFLYSVLNIRNLA